jgi:hypothetical protein
MSSKPMLRHDKSDGWSLRAERDCRAVSHDFISAEYFAKSAPLYPAPCSDHQKKVDRPIDFQATKVGLKESQ